MKIPYSPAWAGSEALIPYVEVVMGSAQFKIRMAALIDSGSDHNLFGVDVAEQCGIDLTRAASVKAGYYQENAEPLSGRLIEVNYQLGRYKWAGETVFVDTPRPYGLLGQRGFFDAFVVTFNYRKGEIDVTRESMFR